MQQSLRLTMLVAVGLLVATAAWALDKPPDSNTRTFPKPTAVTELSSGFSTTAERPAPEQTELSLTLADVALWQGMLDATVSGNYAYCSMFYGLQIVDISNPASPTVIYQYYYPTTGLGLRVLGNTLFAVEPNKGLHVFDVTASPVLLHVFPPKIYSSAAGMAIDGNYLYLACNSVIDTCSGFQVYDISDPMSPLLVGFGRVPMLPMNLDIQGNYAYVADEWNLNVSNITDKQSPQWLGKASCDNDAWDVEVRGNYAYVTNRELGLYVVDISNPQVPVEVTSLPMDTAWFWSTGIKLRGDYAYVQDNDMIKIVNVAVPQSPFIAGSWPTHPASRGLQFLGNTAFIPDWSVGLCAYDVTDPVSPTELWSYGTPGMGYAVALSGNYAFEANGIKGLQVIDVSDPEHLQVVANYDTPGDAQGIAIRDNYAFVTDYLNGLLVFDISNPLSPVPVGGCNTPGKARNIVLAGDYAYIAEYDSGVVIVEIADPGNPAIVNRLSQKNPVSLWIDANRLYVSSWTDTVRIYDVSAPGSPSPIGTYAASGWCGGVAAQGDYLFLAEDNPAPGRYGRLRVIDVGDPQNPLPVADVDSIDFGRGMVISGDYLYIADYTLGVQVFNISNPLAPYRAGRYNTDPGWPWGLVVRGDVIYVAADNGFLTLWTGNCAGPDGQGTYDISDVVYLVAYIFAGGTPPDPLRVGDVNCDDAVDVSDAVYMISYIFAGGAVPCGGC